MEISVFSIVFEYVNKLFIKLKITTIKKATFCVMVLFLTPLFFYTCKNETKQNFITKTVIYEVAIYEFFDVKKNPEVFDILFNKVKNSEIPAYYLDTIDDNVRLNLFPQDTKNMLIKNGKLVYAFDTISDNTPVETYIPENIDISLIKSIRFLEE